MKRGFTIWQFLLLIAVIFILAAIFFPVLARYRENRPKSSCQSNLKNIGLGIKQYVQDYDEMYPLVISGHGIQGWADAIQPYIKSTQVYQCPGEPHAPQSQVNARAISYTDYWMNTRIAGRSEKTFTHMEHTFLLGGGNDGTDSTDARYALDSVPAAGNTILRVR